MQGFKCKLRLSFLSVHDLGNCDSRHWNVQLCYYCRRGLSLQLNLQSSATCDRPQQERHFDNYRSSHWYKHPSRSLQVRIPRTNLFIFSIPGFIGNFKCQSASGSCQIYSLGKSDNGDFTYDYSPHPSLTQIAATNSTNSRRMLAAAKKPTPAAPVNNTTTNTTAKNSTQNQTQQSSTSTTSNPITNPVMCIQEG